MASSADHIDQRQVPPGSDLAEAAEALATAPMFAGLTPLDRAKLAAVLEDRWVEAGAIVFEAGGHGDALYILRSGTAERRVAGTTIGTLTPPEIFGELALLTDEPRSASVAAVTPLRLWVLPSARFHPLLRGDPDLLLRLSASISRQLAQTRRALGEMQRELDRWVAERLDELEAPERELIEQAALFRRVDPDVLAYLLRANAETILDALRTLAARTRLLVADADGFALSDAARGAVVRRLETTLGRRRMASRLRSVGLALEARGRWTEAVEAYLDAGARGEARQALLAAPSDVRDRLAQRMGADGVVAGVDLAGGGERTGNGLSWGGLPRPRLIGLSLAIVPLLFWWAPPPLELATDGWRALLLLVSAAVLLALDLFPDAIVALVLLGGWVVAGLVDAGVALAGFASETWLLVFAVLAIGAAVGSTGLLYRIALGALARTPRGFGWRCTALAAVGAAVTPTLPNATSRMALAAPLVRELAEALGYRPGGRAATGLALAALVGFGQMSGLFLTGSSVGLLVHGLLPPAVRAEFGFGAWFVAALPLYAVLFACSLTTVIYRHRSIPAGSGSADRLALQQAVLGPMGSREWVCLVVLVLLIAGFLSEPTHGIHAAWLGVAALAALVVAGVLDAGILRSGVNWTFLIFFGVVTSTAGVFSTLQIDRWLAGALADPVAAIATSSLGFCLALTLGGFALSFLVRWQAAAPLLTLVAIPVAAPLGVHPFLVALLSLVSTQVWFLPYQSTVYLALYHGSGELFSHAGARPLAILWGPFVLLAVAAAVPVWQGMGLLR